MNKYALQIAAVFAATPLALAGCGSSSEGSPTTDSSSGADDRGAVNNSSGYDNFFDNNPTGENTLSILTTGYPDAVSTCNGATSTNTVVVVNNTPIEQSFTVTDNSELANNLTFYPTWEKDLDVTCANGSTVQSNKTYTVPAGKTFAVNMAAGGYTGPKSDIDGQNHNLSIGAPNTSSEWYDLWLSKGLNGGFESWELGYNGTGGIYINNGEHPFYNAQEGLFNGVNCTNTTSNGQSTIKVTNQIITPYQDSAPNAWNFGSGDPICFAFFYSDADVTYVLDGQESNWAPNPGGGFPQDADVWNYVAPTAP